MPWYQAFTLPIALLLVLPVIWASLDEAHPLVMWATSFVAFFAAAVWYRESQKPAAVGCYFMAIYWALANLSTCWTCTTSRAADRGFPFLASYPPYWLLAPLEHSNWYFGAGYWPMAVLCYWLAILVTLRWTWHWLNRDFDWLVDRVQQRSPTARRR